MRHLRLPVGLIAAALALAVAATPALAHEFMASATGSTKGRSEEPQKLKFGPFNITCAQKFNESEEMIGGAFTLTDKGTVTAGSSKTLNTEVKFLKCTAAAKVGTHTIGLATAFRTPLEIEYHANGFVESGSETEEVEGKVTLAGGKAIEMRGQRRAQVSNASSAGLNRRSPSKPSKNQKANSRPPPTPTKPAK